MDGQNNNQQIQNTNGGNQQNNNNGNNNGNVNQNANQNNNNGNNTNNQHQQEIDKEKIKNDAVSELLKTLGVESIETLQQKLTKQKELEDAEKTEVEKANDTLKETTRQLVEESKSRLMAEAKLQAMILGAKPEMLDDLVTVSMAKVTKEKDIVAVMTEIKEGKTGSNYFGSIEQNEDGKGRNITSRRINGNNQQNQNTNGEGVNKYTGTMAQRLLDGRRQTKSHYFSK